MNHEEINKLWDKALNQNLEVEDLEEHDLKNFNRDFNRTERRFKRIMLKNLRAFKIKFIPVSNSKGARVGIKDLRFNKNKFINYDYEAGNIKEMADNYLKTLGINCLYGAELNEDSYIILTDNFNIMLK